MPPKSESPLWNMTTLHKIFALSSVALILCWVAMVWMDYDREWKGTQKRFFALEEERTRKSLETELATVRDRVAQLDGAIRAEEGRLDDDRTAGEAREALRRARAGREKADAAQKETKGELDSLRYFLDESRHHGDPGEIERRETEFREKELELGRRMEALYAAQREEKAAADRVAEIEKALRDAEAERKTLLASIVPLETRLQKFDYGWKQRVRNIPLLDFMAPPTKVEQTILDDLLFDVNFQKVQAVDRCQTCHIAIDKPGYEDQPHPLRTHPNLLEMYNGGKIVRKSRDASGKSVEVEVAIPARHPFEKLGCTVCHGGKGRATSFEGAVHTPRNEEQEHAWREKYGWHEDEFWNYPMLPVGMTESSCLQCHAGTPSLAGAEKLNRGVFLFRQAGCWGCHKVANEGNWASLDRRAPNLNRIAAKTTPEWTWKWLRAPREFRPGTWMPHYWFLENNSDAERGDPVRNETEIHAIVHTLFARSEGAATGAGAAAAAAGDAARGERLLRDVGCAGCHVSAGDPQAAEIPRDSRRNWGPNLLGTGSKLDRAWLVGWLKDPRSHNPQTRMPSLRLTDSEASDIASYLMTLRDTAWEARTVPPLDEASLDAELTAFYATTMPPADAASKVAGMSRDAKLEDLGSRLVSRYGCFSCHAIAGKENESAIGTELTEEADKTLDKFDFGFADIPHTKNEWFRTKIRHPRIFDVGREKPVQDRLRMPDFGFSEEDAESLTLVVLGLRRPVVSDKLLPGRTPRGHAIALGEQAIEDRNCRGCHVMYGTGGEVRDYVVQKMAAEGVDEADARGYWPPDLTGEGRKVQADWLFRFLQEPTPIRPWLELRMPTFHLSDDRINRIADSWQARDGVETFERPDPKLVPASNTEMARRLTAKGMFECFNCHVRGGQTPPGKGAADLAPDLALAPQRLRRAWIAHWLLDPQLIQKGTKMPSFFLYPEGLPKDILEGDRDRQIGAIADWLYFTGAE